jgi:hypothetical protein
MLSEPKKSIDPCSPHQFSMLEGYRAFVAMRKSLLIGIGTHWTWVQGGLKCPESPFSSFRFKIQGTKYIAYQWSVYMHDLSKMSQARGSMYGAECTNLFSLFLVQAQLSWWIQQATATCVSPDYRSTIHRTIQEGLHNLQNSKGAS